MTELLDKYWIEIVQNQLEVEEEISNKWLEKLKGIYEPRICYNLPYLELKCKYFQEYKDSLKCPKSLFLALIFQTIYYDTKSTDSSEKCIKIFNEFAEEGGIDKDTELIQKVKDLIELSITNSTEAHITPDIYGEEDCHYFLDINFIVWATEWEEYSEFSGKTRREYDFLNDTAYTSLRLKVLQSLLQIPNLFATKDFRSQFEVKARDNMSKEINSLK